MKFVEIRCRNCHSPLNYKEGMTAIRCEYCGSTFVLENENANNKNAENNIVRVTYESRGPIYTTYVPNGWTVAYQENSTDTSKYSCRAFNLLFTEPKENRALVFCPYAIYQDAKGVNMLNMYNLGGMLKSNAVSYSNVDYMTLECKRPWKDINTYFAERMNELVHGTSVQSRKINDFDEILFKTARSYLPFAQKLGDDLEPAIIDCELTLSKGSATYKGIYLASLLIPKNKERKQDTTADTSLFGLFKKGLGGIENSLSANHWIRCCDMILINSSDKDMLRKVLDTLKYEGLYAVLGEEELQKVQQIQMQGALQRQQNQIRASQQLSRTLNETSNLINDSYRQRSQVINRMISKSSEGIRGVNSYTDTYGDTVQADVKYDHIYQNGNTFVGVEDGTLELGPNWTEIKRKD